MPDSGGFAIAAGSRAGRGLYPEPALFRGGHRLPPRPRHILPRTSWTICGISNSPATSGPCRRARRVFPREPIMTVRAPAIQAQLLETFLLLTINHQSLIATKANRIVRAADGRTVLEFGSRRAQGADAAILGRARGLHRRLRRYGLRALRPDLRRPRGRHHGPRLGADVPQPVSRPSSAYCEIYPHERRPAGGHLRHAASAACRTPSARSTRCSKPLGITQVRHPPRLRRHGLPHQTGPQNARRRRLDRVQDHLLQLAWTSTSSRSCCARARA